MHMRVSRNFPPLRQTPLTDTTLMQDIGDLALRMIRERTERGISVTGSAFAPLSAGYAEQKQKAGLPPVANLTVSGRMLNEMVAKVQDPRTVDLQFLTRGGSSGRGQTFIQRSRGLAGADKAFYHDRAGAGRSKVVRRFFDLNDREMGVIQARVDRYLQKVL